jgi:undecaprenyl diphosphate synthase
MSETVTVPTHVGLILDGNRRWARAQGLPTFEGHRKGYENLKTIAKAAFDRGVQYVSAFVFSTENWDRSQEEVDYLMKLLLWVAKSEVSALDKENVRVRFLGSRKRLSKNILDAMSAAETKTEANTGGTLALCLDYGGQQELADAFQTLMRHKTPADEINPDKIAQYLYEPSIPDVDLIIRTSGEQRLSNFMLWRSAYAELYFAEPAWPAFTVDNLDAAIEEYTRRQRRFGS